MGSDSQKADHPFMSTEEDGEFCWHYEMLAHERCGLPRSAHPEPEPAPESVERKLTRPTNRAAFRSLYSVVKMLAEYHTSDSDHCLLCGGDAAAGRHFGGCLVSAAKIAASSAEEPAESEPAPREEPDPLRELAERLVVQPCPHNPDSKLCMGDCVECTRRLLERIVRECAEVAWQSDASGLREDGRYILRRWGLSEEGR